MTRREVGAPVEVEHELEIRRPLSEVFAAISDRERLPAWAAGVKRVRRTPGEPIGVGATYTIVGKVLGRPVRSTYEVTAYHPHGRFGGRMTSSAFTVEETYRLQERDGATVVDVKLAAWPQGRLRLLGPLLGLAVARQLRSDHARLKGMLERSRARGAGAPAPAPAPSSPPPTEDEDAHERGQQRAGEG